jgi:hypothetical protein
MRFIATVIEKLQRHPKRLVFPEGTEPRILQAARQFHSLKLGAPILLGERAKIKKAAEELNISLEGVRIINPEESEELDNFAQRYELLRRRKGIKVEEARDAIREGESIAAPLKRSGQFPSMMVHMVAVGERSGQLEAMLENVAGAYERDVEGKVARLTTVLSPLIIILMALVVVFIVFSVLQPILDMQNFVQ